MHRRAKGSAMQIFETRVGRITAGLWCGFGLACVSQALRWAYTLS